MNDSSGAGVVATQLRPGHRQVGGKPQDHVLVAVERADQGAGPVVEFTSDALDDPAVVAIFAEAAADVHQRQIFGAGDVYVGQGSLGAAGRLIGVQDRRCGQELFSGGAGTC